MGGSLFPSITWILEREGLERARRWQGLATRLGAVLALAAAGIFAVAGGGLVQWIWGADFAGAVPVIGLGLYAVVFLWIGFQHGWLGMLLKTGLPFAIGSLALVLAFAALFRAGGAGGDALGVARLQLVCAAGFMLLVVACLRIGWRQGLPIGRLAVPAVVAAGAAPFLFREPLGLAASLLAVALWTALFVTAAFLSRSITALEIVEVARRLRGRSNGGAG